MSQPIAPLKDVSEVWACARSVYHANIVEVKSKNKLSGAQNLARFYNRRLVITTA